MQFQTLKKWPRAALRLATIEGRPRATGARCTVPMAGLKRATGSSSPNLKPNSAASARGVNMAPLPMAAAPRLQDAVGRCPRMYCRSHSRFELPKPDTDCQTKSRLLHVIRCQFPRPTFCLPLRSLLFFLCILKGSPEGFPQGDTGRCHNRADAHNSGVLKGYSDVLGT